MVWLFLKMDAKQKKKSKILFEKEN